MCGVVGLIGCQGDPAAVNQDIYDALTTVQHRGQDAAGIITSDGAQVFLRKDNGLVRDVFHQHHMVQLSGFMGVGHSRYPTAGCDSKAEAQPFFVNSPFGIALGHNGNLTNAAELAEQLYKDDLRHINTSSDSEILLNVFAHELRRAMDGRLELSSEDIFEAIGRVHARCRGAYAVTAMIVGYGIVAFRDPYGIRPIVHGTKDTQFGVQHMFASESVALDAIGFELVSDVRAGEAVVVDVNGGVYRRVCTDSARLRPCVFEYVYLARPDSIIDGVSVYKTRMRMGSKLADKLSSEWPDHDIQVVIPVPDTSRTAALELANQLGIVYREGFIKNRYIGRTFIMPGQADREKSVRQKLNAIGLEFEGKNVLLVDDSIVRGTTSREIIQMARDAGARRVYFASAAPPVRHPNVYGIDMPSAHELVAHGRSAEEVCREIGADGLIYQDLPDLIEAARDGNPDIDDFEASCFDGEYITGDVDRAYLAALETARSDQTRVSRNRAQLDITEVSESA